MCVCGGDCLPPGWGLEKLLVCQSPRTSKIPPPGGGRSAAWRLGQALQIPSEAGPQTRTPPKRQGLSSVLASLSGPCFAQASDACHSVWRSHYLFISEASRGQHKSPKASNPPRAEAPPPPHFSNNTGKIRSGDRWEQTPFVLFPGC